jgi:ferrous iron transport protein A
MVKNTLLQTPMGATVRIVGFEAEKPLASKLRQYGLFIGDQARLLRLAPFRGPVLIEVNGRELALGHGIAAQIIVEAV